MGHQIKNIKKPVILSIFRILMIFTILEGLYSIFLAFSLPSENEDRILLGLSSQRLILVGVLILILLFFIYAFFKSKKLYRKLLFTLEEKATRETLLLFSLFFFWLSFVRDHIFGSYSSYYVRLSPIIYFASFICLNLLIFNLFGKVSFSKEKKDRSIKIFSIFSSNLLIFLLPVFSIVLFLVTTKIGITPRLDYWGEAGSILLGYQLVFSVLFSISAVLLYKFVLRKMVRHSYIDFLIFLFLWASAIILLINKDLPHNFFYPVTPIPGAERYPFSDASGYDLLANSIIIGKGFSNTAFTSRPVYIVFLSILHYLSNSNYSTLINLQTLALSLSIPLLFLIGKQLHSRFLGFTIALIYIFLELNSIGSAAYVQVSNSKLLLTEPLTGLFIIIITYLLIKGFNNFENKIYLYLSAGVLGLSFFIRAHTVLLIVPISILLIIYSFRNREKWFKNISYYLIISMIVVIPWMVRNYIVVGKFSPDPNRFTLLLNNRWNLNDDKFESNSGKNQKINFTYNKSIAIGDDESVIINMAEHFFHNEILSFLSLPLSYNFQTIDHYYQQTFKFWKDWAGNLENSEKILLSLNVIIFSIGISRSWIKNKYLGLIPMFFQVSYHAGNALVRTSGWRYLKPVDWVVFLYFTIGIIEIINLISNSLVGINLDFDVESSNNKKNIFQNLNKANNKTFFLSATFFLLISVFFSFGPLLVSDRYENQDEYSLHNTVLETLPALSGIGKTELYNDFLLNENAFLEVGKLLYPRYYYSGGLAYKPSFQLFGLEFQRYEFILLNDFSNIVYLPLDNYELIKNGGDVIVLGCRDEGHINALALIFLNEENRVILRSPMLNLQCPLINPDSIQIH